MRVNSSLKAQTFKYDFAIDGGAIGSIPMGIFLPKCQLIGTVILTDVFNSLNSGGTGNSEIDLGFTGGNTAGLIDNNPMGSSATFADYNVSTFGFGIALGAGGFYGFFVPSVSIINLIPQEVLFTIGVDPLIAGTLQATILYIEF